MDTTTPQHEKWLLDAPRTLDLPPIRRLKVGLVRGQIDIVAHDEPETRLEVHEVSGKPLRITLDRDELEIDHPQLRWDNWIETMMSFSGKARADVSLLVPREVAIKLGVVSAGALVSGVLGDASLSTVSGDIVTDGLEGSLQLNSVSGELTVRDHRGPVRAHTVSGDVTASGALTRFSSDGVSAETFVDASGTPDSIDVNSVSGAITVRMDAGVPAAYAVSSVGGRIQLDGRTFTGFKGRITDSVGDLAGAFADVRLNSVGGDISVVRRTVAAGEGPASAAAGPAEGAGA